MRVIITTILFFFAGTSYPWLKDITSSNKLIVVNAYTTRCQHCHRHGNNAVVDGSRLFPRKCQFFTTEQLKASSIPGTEASNKYRNGPILDDIPPTLQPLFSSAINATILRDADTSKQGHDPFRYEWGTWIVEDSIRALMTEVNRITLQPGTYDKLLLQLPRIISTAWSEEPSTIDTDTTTGRTSSPETITAHRWRVAGGSDWDCLLHVLPPGTNWTGQWVTGSWVVLKALTGLVEISALSGPNPVTGQYRAKTKRNLRGGTDGSLGGIQSSVGDDCVKYVGGPLRSYLGKYGKTVLLEIVLRPPIAREETESLETLETLSNIQEIFAVTVEQALVENFKQEAGIQHVANKNESNLVLLGTTASRNSGSHLGKTIGMDFQEVGGLNAQLDAIARRVLASRANPQAARRLGISHVRGILLSGPPGCGKTLLARELARLLGAREPQIVNGPEILDKYIGEAEKKVRELFAPAELEYQVAGENSALHIIILDEMDAIARKRGTMTSDTTGVRDSVVNQLLAKMDGVNSANNFLVVGLTNRPELLDPALLRPGRLEVQLRVELPDLEGRRDILSIHTRKMREVGGIDDSAVRFLEDLSDNGVPARTENFSGAELAGLVRSAASFALARALELPSVEGSEGLVTVADVESALREVRPALGKQEELLKARYPLGISPCSLAMQRIMRDLTRFTSLRLDSPFPKVQSLILVGAGGNGGAGATALAAWAASDASTRGRYDHIRFITAVDLITHSEGGSEEGRAAALLEQFSEAKEMQKSLLIFDDIDYMCAGNGIQGYSHVMLATLRALLRSPPAVATAPQSGHTSPHGRIVHVLATTSRSDAACDTLHELFDETIVTPLLEEKSEVQKLLHDCLPGKLADTSSIASLMIERLGKVGCKNVLRLAERALVASRDDFEPDIAVAQYNAMSDILNDLAIDQLTARKLCEIL